MAGAVLSAEDEQHDARRYLDLVDPLPVERVEHPARVGHLPRLVQAHVCAVGDDLAVDVVELDEAGPAQRLGRE